MTGFSTVTFSISGENGSVAQVTLHLKTLNARFFETTCKLPQAFTNLETIFIQELKKKLLRGSIYLTATINPPQALAGVAQPSLVMIESYINTIKKIQTKFSLKGEITVSDILQLPDIFQMEEKMADPVLQQKIMSALLEVIDSVIETRAKEGILLEQDLSQRINILSNEIQTIELLSSKALEKKTEQVAIEIQKLQELKEGESLLEAKRAAFYLQLDRMDIHEEIIRFKAHIKNISDVLKSKDNEKGKRLDFIVQELMREANTIAAKAPDVTISSHAISIKVELEKMREQSQNIV